MRHYTPTYSNDELQKQAYERMALAFDVAGIGFWDWKFKTNEVFYDRNWLRLLGFEPQEVTAYATFWEDRIHPDDKDIVLEALQSHLDGNTSEYKIEHRVRNKTGEYIWILDTGKVTERDEEGRPVRIIGISLDVSEKYINRQRIQESEERFRSIFDHLNDAFCRFGFDGTIFEVNQNLCDLLGQKKEALIGSNIKLFFKNSDIKFLYKRLSNILDKKALTFETQIVTGKQKSLPVSISARLITNENSGIIQALIRDISIRKVFEKAMIDEKNKLHALITHSPYVILRFGKNCKCQYLSPNIKNIMGINPEKGPGQKLQDFGFPTNLAKYIEENIRISLKNKKETDVKFSFETPEGIKHFEANIVPEPVSKDAPESVLITVADITEKINREKELRASKQILEEVERNAHFGSYEINLITQVCQWSKETNYIFERADKLPAPSLTEINTDYIYPDDIQFVRKQFTWSICHRQNFNLAFRVRTANQNIKLIHTTNSIIVNADSGKVEKITGIIKDITRVKQVEDQIFTERDILQDILDNLPDGIFVKDLQGKFLRANKQLAKMFNFRTTDEIVGKTIYDIFQEPVAEKFSQSDITIATMGEPLLNIEFEHPFRNQKAWFSKSVLGIKDQTGKVVQILGIIRDVTDAKKAQQELLEAKEKAEESDKLKSAFLANMSHEIRTPINGILGFANLMELREFPREKEIQYLQIINNSGKLLLNLINDIIDIAKIEAGQLNIEYTNVHLPSMINDLSLFYQGEKIRRNRPQLEIKTYIPDDTQYHNLLTDPFRLRQIINNLLSNSMKFCEQGFIEFGFYPDNHSLVFYTRDTGIGISAEELRIIFDRFKQAGQSSRKKEGTGLGLAISKGLVNLLGGEIWAESIPGQGTSFYFYLPMKLIQQAPGDNHNNVPQHETSAVPDLHNKIVLVVEDEQVNYTYLEELMKVTSAQLIHAPTAEDAIKVVKTNQHIDIILMDMRLPGINGFDATKLIKKMKNDIPVVALTAYAMENERRKCLEAGCDEYIAKPFDQKTLFQVLYYFLN